MLDQVIHTMKYARSLPDGSLESWEDSVDRYFSFLQEQPWMTPEIQESLALVIPQVLEKQVMPSMRLLATAGPAASRENLTAFNCMYMELSSWDRLPDLMYALMCGTGVGFSVQRRHLRDFPLSKTLRPVSVGIVPQDSREGWVWAYREYLQYLVSGRIPQYDLSLIRPEGSPLKTTGGYASGPKPLEELFKYTLHLFKHMTVVTPLLLYDLATKVADVVVQGGVRRSACIALFDYDDEEMLLSKAGDSLSVFPHRANANNSAVFPTVEVAREHLPEILKLTKDFGEPGIVIQECLQSKAQQSGRLPGDFGVNPCGEIILRDGQVCNLTEVVLRPNSTIEDNMEQVEAAVLLGLCQLKLNRFCREHCKVLKDTYRLSIEEPLLGVSLTGLVDEGELLGDHLGGGLQWLREYAHQVASFWAPRFDLENIPTAITCVKPSGTVSKLVDCSPGIHPRFSQYYLQNVGVPKGSPLEKFLSKELIPRHTTDSSVVFSFPTRAPQKHKDLSAIDQLWNIFRINRFWCDHNCSATVYVREHEWPEVTEWCLERTDELCGITFMPYQGEIPGVPYMPLEKTDEAIYVLMSILMKQVARVSWVARGDYAREHEPACGSGGCLL